MDKRISSQTLSNSSKDCLNKSIDEISSENFKVSLLRKSSNNVYIDSKNTLNTNSNNLLFLKEKSAFTLRYSLFLTVESLKVKK